MAKQTVHAVVARGGYVFRGNSIPKGRVVKMDQETFDRTQRSLPSDYRLATAEEVKKADTILDLSTVEPAAAQNIADAEAAVGATEPTAKKKS